MASVDEDESEDPNTSACFRRAEPVSYSRNLDMFTCSIVVHIVRFPLSLASVFPWLSLPGRAMNCSMNSTLEFNTKSTYTDEESRTI